MLGHGGQRDASILALPLCCAILLVALLLSMQEVHTLRHGNTGEEIVEEIAAMCTAGAQKS